MDIWINNIISTLCLNDINKSHDVLDIGSAYGIFSFPASAKSNSLVAMDIEKRHLDILKKSNKFKNLKTLKGKIPEINFKSNRFDIVHCSKVFHFFTDEEIIFTLKKIYKWLKNNGKAYILITKPGDASNSKDLLNYLKKQKNNYIFYAEKDLFINFIDKNRFLAMCINENFNIYKIIDFCTISNLDIIGVVLEKKKKDRLCIL